MILITNQYYVAGIDSSVSGGLLGSDVIISSPAFTQLALESVMGGFGKVFVAIALFFFAFTTLRKPMSRGCGEHSDFREN